MSLNLVAKVRKPTRLLTRDWSAQLDAVRRNIRGRTYSDTYFDPYAGAIMLTPQIDPGYWQYGKNGYTLQVWNGAAWISYPQGWVEGENAFGDEGSYVGFAGDSTYAATTPWAAYRASDKVVVADGPIAFTLHWTPPTGTFLPRVEFWPRVDTTQTVSSGGYPYYHAPLGFYLDYTNADLVVCEYESDSPEGMSATTMLNETYRHPLDTMMYGLSGRWVSFTLIPTPETYVDSASEATYHDDFVLKSPMLKGGGFCYRSKVKRKNLRLFPQGIAGIRSLTGGVAALTIPYVYFPTTGYFLSQVFTKRGEDTSYPWAVVSEYLPTGTSTTTEFTDEDGVAIPAGTSFQRYRVKVTLNASAGGYSSPIVYSVTPSIDGDASDVVQAETDISADVNITESSSEDLTGYRATINLRNLDRVYDGLVSRPSNEIAFSFGGTNRSVLYTLNPSYQWFRTPRDPALNINWECGDFWVRLKRTYIAGMPDYGCTKLGADASARPQTISDAITDYMERLGFDTSLLHIDATLDDPLVAMLPWSSGKDDPLCKPQDGSTADEFLADLHEKWFSDYSMYFGADDVGGVLKPALYIEAPPNLADPASIHRTFYTSRATADWVTGDREAFLVCGNPTVSVQHDQFKNEIWVFGIEPATQNPIADMWLDLYSQTDENYLYYTGNRDLLIVITRLPTQEYVSAYLSSLVKVFGRPRRAVSFESKYDPTLRSNDYIRFYGVNAIFKVTGIDATIDSSHVSQLYDDRVHGCRIEALEWPTI